MLEEGAVLYFSENWVSRVGHITVEQAAEQVSWVYVVDFTDPLYVQFLDYASGVAVAFLPALAIAVAGLAVVALRDR